MSLCLIFFYMSLIREWPFIMYVTRIGILNNYLLISTFLIEDKVKRNFLEEWREAMSFFFFFKSSTKLNQNVVCQYFFKYFVLFIFLNFRYRKTIIMLEICCQIACSDNNWRGYVKQALFPWNNLEYAL